MTQSKDTYCAACRAGDCKGCFKSPYGGSPGSRCKCPHATEATFEEEAAITALLRLGYVIGINDEDGEPHRICDEGECRMFVEGFYGASIVNHADACRELIAKRKNVCG